MTTTCLGRRLAFHHLQHSSDVSHAARYWGLSIIPGHADAHSGEWAFGDTYGDLKQRRCLTTWMIPQTVRKNLLKIDQASRNSCCDHHNLTQFDMNDHQIHRKLAQI